MSYYKANALVNTTHLNEQNLPSDYGSHSLIPIRMSCFLSP